MNTWQILGNLPTEEKIPNFNLIFFKYTKAYQITNHDNNSHLRFDLKQFNSRKVLLRQWKQPWLYFTCLNNPSKLKIIESYFAMKQKFLFLSISLSFLSLYVLLVRRSFVLFYFLPRLSFLMTELCVFLFNPFLFLFSVLSLTCLSILVQFLSSFNHFISFCITVLFWFQLVFHSSF